jgi:hypothetical protein
LLTAAAFALALILLAGLIPLPTLLTSLTSLTSLASLLAALLAALVLLTRLVGALLLVIALRLWLLGIVRHVDTPRMFGSTATVEPSAAARM